MNFSYANVFKTSSQNYEIPYYSKNYTTIQIHYLRDKFIETFGKQVDSKVKIYLF